MIDHDMTTIVYYDSHDSRRIGSRSIIDQWIPDDNNIVLKNKSLSHTSHLRHIIQLHKKIIHRMLPIEKQSHAKICEIFTYREPENEQTDPININKSRFPCKSIEYRMEMAGDA